MHPRTPPLVEGQLVPQFVTFVLRQHHAQGQLLILMGGFKTQCSFSDEREASESYLGGHQALAAP